MERPAPWTSMKGMPPTLLAIGDREREEIERRIREEEQRKREELERQRRIEEERRRKTNDSPLGPRPPRDQNR